MNHEAFGADTKRAKTIGQTGMLTIFLLTLYDALRRKILLASLLVGAAFVVVFAVAVYFGAQQLVADATTPFLLKQGQYAIFGVLGLFATNFLAVMFAILLPVDALSGEIASGTMQTLASKPLRRVEIVLGKWLAHWAVVAAYLALIAGGVLVSNWAITGYAQPRPLVPLALMLLEVTLLVTVSIAGGTRLSTVTNGIAAMGFYGVAFVGGWMEQIGALANLSSARTVGVLVSLISPADAMWRLAAYYLQPPLIRNLQATPFVAASVPNALMVWWTVAFTLVVLAIGVREFGRRPL